MSTLSIRFPDDLERKLDEEARLSHRRRSDLVREAVQEYVEHREQERFMQGLVDEMRAWQDNTAARQECRDLSDDMPDDDLDAMIRTEQRAGIDPGQRWWK